MANKNHHHGYPVRLLQTLYKDLETEKPKKKAEQAPGRKRTMGIISEMLERYTTKQLEDMAIRNGLIRRKPIRKYRRRELISIIASHEYRKMNRRKGHRSAPCS